jgi:hypothetical protein
MKRLLLLFFLLPCFLIGHASGIGNAKGVAIGPGKNAIPWQTIAKLTPKEYEKLTGKKMKWKEKIGLKILKWKAKRMADKPTDQQRKMGWLALVLGAVGLICIFIPVGVIFLVGLGAAIAGFIIGLKSIKGNANTPGIIGIVLSSVALVLVLAALIYVLAGGVIF